MSQPLSRSERKTDFWGRNTPENVGPGSYSSSPSPVRGAVKLASMSRPRSIFPSGQRTPGPGAYNLAQPIHQQPNIRGSSSFLNGELRLNPTVPGSTGPVLPSSYHTPGPGSYDLVATKEKNGGSVEKRRVPKEVKPTPTSIPVTISERLELSPASYYPSLTLIRKKANEMSFSTSKDARRLWEPLNRHFNRFPSPENPGPGAYTTESGKKKKAEIGNASFMSKVPLLGEQKRKEIPPSPGPGSYDPVGFAEIPHELVGFGSRIERGETWSYDIELPYTKPERVLVPGAGSYSQRGAGIKKGKTKIRKENTDLETSSFAREPRDCLVDMKVDPIPGPGSYTPDLVGIKQPSKVTSMSSGAQFRLEERFKNGLFEPKDGPSPGEYHREEEREKGKSTNASFKSRSERFKAGLRENAMVTVVGQDVSPPVGAYNFPSSWKNADGRLNLSFDSSARRLNAKETASEKKSPTPGPGKYDPLKSFPHKSIPIVLKAKRFPNSKPGEIGPGKYHFENSLIKKSFNFTINPPQDRPKLWTLT